ncbi:MAG: hypothetical protein PHS44_01445 [Candidatus Dojkabacteria bacterium]|jgi:hypothetical protein|nr:hypothetical protein [Candidatus Dojkabacteria bacterium]
MPEIPTDFASHFGDMQFVVELATRLLVPDSCKAIRDQSHARKRLEAEAAERVNKPVTLEEFLLGTRLEYIEWEIRSCVHLLWQKGFTTYASGYSYRRGEIFPNTCDGAHFLRFVSRECPPESVLKQIWSLTDNTGILTYTSIPYIEDALTIRNRFPDREFIALSDQFGDGTPLWLWEIDIIYTGGDAQILNGHWDLIAETIPDLGWHLLRHNSYGAQNFRKKHALIQPI